MLSVTEIQKRPGWSRKAVKVLLGSHDSTEPNPCGGPARKLYNEDRVVAMEQTGAVEEFTLAERNQREIIRQKAKNKAKYARKTRGKLLCA